MLDSISFFLAATTNTSVSIWVWSCSITTSINYSLCICRSTETTTYKIKSVFQISLFQIIISEIKLSKFFFIHALHIKLKFMIRLMRFQTNQLKFLQFHIVPFLPIPVYPQYIVLYICYMKVRARISVSNLYFCINISITL